MSDLTRRVVLQGALGGTALLVAGCSADSLPIPIIGGKDPDEELRVVTAAAERALIAAYDSVFAAEPTLERELGQFKAQHEQHLAVLLDGLEPEPAPIPSIQATGAIRTLRRLESRAARQRAEACVTAQEAQWVQVLALIGASEAGHAAALAKLKL